VREALSAIVGTLEGFCVKAEASTADEAIEAATLHRPYLALVDQDLPDFGGEWTIQTLRQRDLVQGIVAISLRADQPTRVRAYAAGAQACVQTGASASEVLEAIKIALGAPDLTPEKRFDQPPLIKPQFA
jgi:DNA-binding NarL/FixJ family response regulator